MSSRNARKSCINSGPGIAETESRRVGNEYESRVHVP